MDFLVVRKFIYKLFIQPILNKNEKVKTTFYLHRIFTSHRYIRSLVTRITPEGTRENTTDRRTGWKYFLFDVNMMSIRYHFFENLLDLSIFRQGFSSVPSLRLHFKTPRSY